MKYDTHTTSNTLSAKPINTSMFLADFRSADFDARSTYHKVRLTGASRHRSETMLRSERRNTTSLVGVGSSREDCGHRKVSYDQTTRKRESYQSSGRSSVHQQLSFIFPKSQLTFNFVLSNLIANKQERRTL